MVKLITLVTALAGMSTVVMSAPTNSATITVQNNCKKQIQVNQLSNGGGGNKDSTLAPGSSTELSVPSNWGGRIWAREECSGSGDCQAGSSSSLAEFLLKGASDKDYYDVSFVDGFNLPISIAPNSGEADGYDCGVPACSSLPDCPEELQDKDSNGNVVGCKSACAAFGTDEYCCTGSSGGRGDCSNNKYSAQVKDACPDVYTYAHDDSTSMYACSPGSGYTVTFC